MPSSTAKTIARPLRPAVTFIASAAPGLARSGVSTLTSSSRLPRLSVKGATAWLSGLMNTSSEAASRTKDTDTYPPPSSSAGTRIRCTLAVSLVANHFQA